LKLPERLAKILAGVVVWASCPQRAGQHFPGDGTVPMQKEVTEQLPCLASIKCCLRGRYPVDVKLAEKMDGDLWHNNDLPIMDRQ
jgi:hypothetical protein